MLNIKDYKKWHFIGVGGVSMSKLCAYLVAKGCICTGSDAVYCDNIAKLREIGVVVCVGVDKQLAENADIVVYNAAIPPTHIERISAKFAIERKELLGMVEREFNNSIAVSGAHGKTTVSSILSFILKDMGLDVMAHVGGDIIGVNPFDAPSNDEYIVSEACEYSRSFLQLNPDFGIIVNIDYDHPDCYRDIEDTYEAFSKFLIKTKKFALIDRACISKLMNLTQGKLNKDLAVYTFGETPLSDYYPCNAVRHGNGYIFNIIHHDKNLGVFYIDSINAINVKCATIAVAACDILCLPLDDVKRSLKAYKGVKRRMEYLGNTRVGAGVYTDYAHHPKELLSLHSNLPKDIIDNTIIIFQPHTYSRTKALYGEFIECLKLFNRVIILPTYAARELPEKGLSGEQLYQGLVNNGCMCEYFHKWEDLSAIIPSIKTTDTILLVGAGIDYMEIFQVLKQ